MVKHIIINIYYIIFFVSLKIYMIQTFIYNGDVRCN